MGSRYRTHSGRGRTVTAIETARSGLQTRAFPTIPPTETEDESHTVGGLAVPYGVETELWPGLREIIELGAVEVETAPRLFWCHEDPIGVLTDWKSTPEGWEIDAAISDTTLGRDALTLVRDKAISNFSIGFLPIKNTVTDNSDGSKTIRHQRIKVVEVSLVPFPAYDAAQITREHATRKETLMTDAPSIPSPDPSELTQLRNAVAENSRAIALVSERIATPGAPATPTDTRTAGRALRDMVVGRDTETADRLAETWSRDYSGSTDADGIYRPTWLADLTRLVDDANPLATLFSTGTLPPSGMTLEYGELATNTITVGKQTRPGDNLPQGKLGFTTKSATVETFGGYVELSVQAIERSSVQVLDMSMRAQAIAAGVQLAGAFAAQFTATVTAQKASNAVSVSAVSDWAAWFAANLAAAKKMQALGLTVDGLILDEATWTTLGTLKDTSGRPLLDVSGDGSNTVGTISLPGVSGDILRVPALCNLKAPAGEVAYYNKAAIRLYSSPLARLQDSTAINLTRAFSVYQYAAIAVEIPAAIIPVTITPASE